MWQSLFDRIKSDDFFCQKFLEEVKLQGYWQETVFKVLAKMIANDVLDTSEQRCFEAMNKTEALRSYKIDHLEKEVLSLKKDLLYLYELVRDITNTIK